MCIVYMAVKMQTKLKAYGLCHCVQGSVEQLSQYLEIPLSSLTYLCAGINHMGWFLEIKVNGKDAYPILKEKSNSLEKIKRLSNLEKHYSAIGVKLVDTIRFEVMNHFGYFTDESPFHLSEYLPYFRKNLDSIKRFEVMDRWWLKHEQDIDKIYSDIKNLLNSNEVIKIEKSDDYFPDIVHALETNKVFKPNINVLNTGLIPNLPNNCCVEIPCVVDASGIHPCYIGNLPEQCAALNRTNINVQIMAVKAALEKDKLKKKQYIMQAIKLDPLTSSILTLDEITKMVEELIDANREYINL